jgi:hypothetical protein
MARKLEDQRGRSHNAHNEVLPSCIARRLLSRCLLVLTEPAGASKRLAEVRGDL